MKILILTNHSYMLYQFRKELIAKLLEEHEVIISTPCVGHEDDLREMGCQVIDTFVDRRGINPITDMKLLKTYHSLIKQIHPDKVLTYSIKPNIYGGMVCQKLHIPYYCNVQGLGTAFQKKGLASFVTALYKYAFKKVNTVFFENTGNAQVFVNRKIISQDKIVVLNGAGVNLEQYQYQPYPTNEKIHFLFVGRIMKEKGVDELFAAIEKLNRNDVVLDIVGFFEDEYKERIDELINKGLAIFHGFQKDVIPFYKKANCVVLPSYHEGMSNVLLEASALGRPIITSNIYGCKEAVDESISGYLCTVQDTNSLYEQLDKFCHLSHVQRETMGIKAKEKMVKEFDKKLVVEKTYKELML